MGSYVANTPAVRQELLDAVGADSIRALYRDVPEALLYPPLALDAEKSELEIRSHFTALAEKNKVFPTCLRGAGAYRHFIPAAVRAIVSREELLTAYTPYQAEVSQGLLQGIFEYQTMICELTGMEVSNASVYDGATAAAEAIHMCLDRKRTKIYVSAAAHPETIETIRTYCFGYDLALEVLPLRDGRTDLEALTAALGEDAACFYLQQPNYFGLVEDAQAVGATVHAAGAKFIMGVNPIACALLPTPGACGADIAVGDGQPLGLDLAFGGPYLGFMAATKKLMRQLPGRIVGQTQDTNGATGYVLTLTAREQHIRREKAGSNICSNQALCAFTAGAYLAAMGPEGLAQAARLSLSKAHYLAQKLAEAGLSRRDGGEFFHEFVTACDEDTAAAISAVLAEHGILGGLPVEGGLLWCVTELVSRDALDKTADLVKEVLP